MSNSLPRPPFYSDAIGMWIISNYHDVTTVLKNTRSFLSIPTYAPMFQKLEMCQDAVEIMNQVIPLSTNRISTSPVETHTRLRDEVKKQFSLESINVFKKTIEYICQDTLNHILDTPTFDLVSNYCKPISLRSVLQFVGIPECDFKYIEDLHNKITRLFVQKLHPIEQIATAQCLYALKAYLNQLIIDKMESPGTDLTSSLVSPINPNLSREEINQLLCDTISAGFDTTLNAMNWTFYRLISNQNVWRNLSPTNARQMKQYVEETLRLNLAQMGLVRLASEDSLISDIHIPEGSVIYVMHTFANRDAIVFHEPNQLCAHRKKLQKQLTFGYGMHYCLGAHLAKSEIEVALQCLRKNRPNLIVVKDGTHIFDSGVMKLIQKLTVTNLS